ncbi:MAG TPA: PD-(D/E)XK nuclease family protein [Clostridia bacterium]|nr:PD-(D/E)XK nuclease family protein [Clostridia bacterium]
MGADVTLVVGRAGAGKSAYLHGCAAKIAAAGGRAYYIVPEQFTFETERALCAKLGGLIDIHVCSFTTLAERVLRETGERRVFLTRQGRRMVIRKCAEDLADALVAFARVRDRPGFSEACDEFFTLCKRFDIYPEQLSQAAEKLPEGAPLQEKLTDLARLYGAYQEHLGARRMDAEDAFFALCERLPQSGVRGAEIVIDGFDLVSEQLFDIISALMDVCSHMTVALRADPYPPGRDARVFAAEERVRERIEAIAAGKKRSVGVVRLPRGGAAIPESETKAPALAHLEREGFAYPYAPFSGSSGGAIRLFAGTDVRAEAEAAADAALAAADAGMRYRDMAIIATNMELYLEPVSRALRARGIPFFTDAKRPLSVYPAARLARAALAAAAREFSASQVLAAAKTGLALVGREEAEALENYVLARGGRRIPFAKPFPQDAPEAAETARMKLMGPLAALRAGLSSRDAAGKAAALYEYMEALSLRDQLAALTSKLRAEGSFELMEEHAQVYNMLLELISQLHAILGGAKISNARFLDIFEEGISSYEVGVIPTSADQLLLGSLGRSRARPLEALFVLGASQGMFPASVADDGMISDEEIASLASLGLAELPDTRRRADKELSDVYGAVTKPRRLLYLSYSLDGAQNAPCALIDRVRELFSDVRLNSDIEPAAPGSPETALRALAVKLRAGVDAGELSEDAARLYAAFAARDPGEGWGKRLFAIERALFHSVSPEPFGRELASALYGAPLYGSASRAETYHACPFRHFARYGLRLAPRREYREQPADEGNFCHDALCAFTRALTESGKAPGAICEEEVDAMLARILPELAQTHNNGILLDTPRNRALLARLCRRISATAKAIVRQLAAGGFRVEGSEVEFGPGKPFPALTLELAGGGSYILSGRIDRVDAYESPSGETYVRVVDYKLGFKSLSYGEIDAGLALQLPLYIRAVTAAAKAERRAAGMYYMRVREPSLPELDADEWMKKLNEQFRMAGISVRDAALLEAGGAGVVIPRANSMYTVGEERFFEATSRALARAKDAAAGILEGRADAAPVRRSGGGTACAYCDFPTLCAFDAQLPGCAYRSVKKMKADAFFSGEGGDGKLDA